LTLIEVMMALVLATLGLLGNLMLMSVMLQGSSFTRDLTDATALVQAGLEAEVSRAAVTLSSPPNGTTVSGALDSLGRTSQTGPYTRSVTWGLSSDGQRRLVTVTVNFTDPRGKVHSVTAQRERNP
jgi:hypothetical protein